MSEKTPVQQRFLDAQLANKDGLPPPSVMARATGGDPEYLSGLQRAHLPPGYYEERAKDEERRLNMAGMGGSESEVIGAALIVEDIKKLFELLRSRGRSR